MARKMELVVDYPGELRRILKVRPSCPLELARRISREHDLEIGDVKLHVLLELRKMINSGEVELLNMGSHDRYVVQHFPE